MINNKQVNLWRGDGVPPTIYHVWIKDNNKLLLYNGKEWVIFLDNAEIVEDINKIIERVDALEKNTVNGKFIKDNPVLTGDDINTTPKGTFINSTTITNSFSILDSLLTTQIIE